MAVIIIGPPHPRIAYNCNRKRSWNTVTVTTLCKYKPSINIHINIAVLAYSSRIYDASQRYGCKERNENKLVYKVELKTINNKNYRKGSLGIEHILCVLNPALLLLLRHQLCRIWTVDAVS